ncbi:hypothetical protein ACHAPE_003988 [Trichoderma viride]
MKADRIMGYLLDTKGDEIQITEDVLMETTRNPYGFAMLRVIFRKNGDKIQITEKILKAIAEMNTSNSEMVKFMVNAKGNETKFIEEVLLKAVIIGNRWESLIYLLDIHGDKIEITREILNLAIGSKSSIEILSIISKSKGDKVQITEEIKKMMSEEQLQSWDRPKEYRPPLSLSPTSFVAEIVW